MFGEWESKVANCARSKTGLRHENDPQEDQCADTRLEFPTCNTLSSWPVQFVTLIHFVEVFLHFRQALLKDRIHIFVVSFHRSVAPPATLLCHRKHRPKSCNPALHALRRFRRPSFPYKYGSLPRSSHANRFQSSAQYTSGQCVPRTLLRMTIPLLILEQIYPS